MNKELTCIVCPKGCTLQAEITGREVRVSGHTCKRGEEYAVAECLHPTRTVTALVRVGNRPNTMVSVKTDPPIAKEHIFDLMQQLATMQAQAPLQIGQPICPPLFGSQILVTKQVD